MRSKYWRLVSNLVQAQLNGTVGLGPHPLLHIMENIRERIGNCSVHLRQLEGASEAESASDDLIGQLIEGEIAEIAEAPEWAEAKRRKGERFIARARLELARKLRLSCRWLHKEVMAGRIPSLKAGKQRRFSIPPLSEP